MKRNCKRLTALALAAVLGTSMFPYSALAVQEVAVEDSIEAQTVEPEAQQEIVVEDSQSSETVEAAAEGTCGEKLTWTLDDEGTLTISGSGKMQDFNFRGAPWDSSCSGIKKIVVEEDVTSIGQNAFYDCDSCTSVTLPTGLTSIGNYTFYGCRSLTSVSIPNSVTSIGGAAFYGCSSLTSIKVEDGNAVYCSENGVLFNEERTTIIHYPAGCAEKSYTIPSSVTSIGEETFFDCDSLTSVSIPDSVTSIGDWAFAYCRSLTSVSIPDSVTSIGNWAFSSCRSLTSVSIPSSVTSIRDYAFGGCSSLKDVYYSGSESDWKKISIDSDSPLTGATIHYNSTGPEGEDSSSEGETGSGSQKDKMALSMSQVWGFENGAESGMKYKYYAKFLGPAFSTILYTDNVKEYGRCSGMVVSTISISGHDAPPVSSFENTNKSNPTNLHEITDQNTKFRLGTIYHESAEDFIGYAHAYQHTPKYATQKQLNKNNLSKLYKKVVESTLQGKDYIEISIRGDYGGNVGHSLLAMGIGEDTNEMTEIFVYDSNIQDELQSLYLYKENGKYVSWSYYPGYINWGSNKKYASISYITEGNNFSRDFFSDIYSRTALTEYNLFSTERNDLTLSVKDGGQYDLSDDTDLDNSNSEIVLVESDSIVKGMKSEKNHNNLYWINSTEEINVKNTGKNDKIKIASERNMVTMNLPTDATASTSVSDESGRENYCNLKNLAVDSDYSLEFTSYSQDSELHSCSTKISGGSPRDLDAKMTDAGLVLSSEHLNDITLSSELDEEKTDTFKIATSEESVLVKNNSGEITVYQDSDNNDSYETLVADHSQHTVELRNAREATCKEAGYTGDEVCTVCDETVKKGETIAKTAHTVVVDAAVEATYAETGLTEGSHCSVCGEVLTEQEVTPVRKVSALTKQDFTVKNIKGKKLRVKWTKADDVSAYQIQYAANSSFKKAKTVTVKSKKPASKRISHLKKGKKYSVRMRTYKKYNGKKYYSDWSSAKRVTIKK